MKTTVKFEKISLNEIKFSFRNRKFLLAEKSQGVYGRGRCINLYQLNGLTKEFIKTVGWTQSDNHGGPDNSCITGVIITFDACKDLAVTYIDKLLS
jgi:hypothetical protein